MIRAIVPLTNRLGEGALWHTADQCLYWTDITRFLVCRYDPATQAVRTWAFAEPCVALFASPDPDWLIVALGSGLMWWHQPTDHRAPFGFALPDWPNVRLNDGRVAPDGDIWIGSMANNVGPNGQDIPITDPAAGQLFQISGEGKAQVRRAGIGISNTVCWSPDGRWFYFADSLLNRIDRFAYAADGALGEAEPLLVDHPRGVPDGSSMDAEGCLWNCRWGGAGLLRISPEGHVLAEVDLPTANPTTCVFGGSDLRTLYVTSAANADDPADRWAGALFALDPGVQGLAVPPVRFSPPVVQS